MCCDQLGLTTTGPVSNIYNQPGGLIELQLHQTVSCTTACLATEIEIIFLAAASAAGGEPATQIHHCGDNLTLRLSSSVTGGKTARMPVVMKELQPVSCERRGDERNILPEFSVLISDICDKLTTTTTTKLSPAGDLEDDVGTSSTLALCCAGTGTC